MAEINKDELPRKNSLVQRLKESTEKREKELSELFDEQMEEVKDYLIKNMMYSLTKPKTENFVEFIDEYRNAYVDKKLLVSEIESQRDSVNTSSNLLNNLVDTKVVHETLTYVLRELKAVDEDGYILEECESL